jgi:hypothetical protein
VESYSWATAQKLIETLAEKMGHGKKAGPKGKPPSPPGLEVESMHDAEYYKRMGVTDPKILSMK